MTHGRVKDAEILHDGETPSVIIRIGGLPYVTHFFGFGQRLDTKDWGLGTTIGGVSYRNDP